MLACRQQRMLLLRSRWDGSEGSSLLTAVTMHSSSGGLAVAIAGSGVSPQVFEQCARVVHTALSTPLTCGAGSVAVFSGWLPHRSARNRSRTPRCAIYLTYVQAEGKSRLLKIKSSMVLLLNLRATILLMPTLAAFALDLES